MSAERHPLRAAARYAVLAGVVTFFAVPVYVFVEPPWRGFVVRAASALVLGIALLELRRSVVERVWDGGPSALDAERRRVTPAPELSPRFVTLLRDVRAGISSARHFDLVLWPRLVALARRPPFRPAVRPLRRGPSLEDLRDAIASIEREP
jgi:hypothetical protein